MTLITKCTVHRWIQNIFFKRVHFYLHFRGTWKKELSLISNILILARPKIVSVISAGRYVRDICIYGLEDLAWIINRNSMFANKFESSTFPEALDCIEQWHRDKVLRQATVPIEPSWLLAIQGNSSTSSHYNISAEP